MFIPLSISPFVGCAAILALLVSATASQSQEPSIQLTPIESVDAATRSMWLIDGIVVDAETSRPITDFAVTPATISTDDRGRTKLRWRDNLKRQMNSGRLRWPRTSGFSVMRFRVTAPGYRPAITQRIWRGGPHTQIKVRLKPAKPTITHRSGKQSS